VGNVCNIARQVSAVHASESIEICLQVGPIKCPSYTPGDQVQRMKYVNPGQVVQNKVGHQLGLLINLSWRYLFHFNANIVKINVLLNH
jgi:hypothetical protein